LVVSLETLPWRYKSFLRLTWISETNFTDDFFVARKIPQSLARWRINISQIFAEKKTAKK